MDCRGWGRTAATMLDCRLRVWNFSAKTRKKGVGEGFARGRSDAYVSLFLRGKKRMLKGANMSRMEMCIRIGVPFTDGVALYL